MDDLKIYEEKCEKIYFPTHKAKILVNDPRYLIIDWRREDDSGEYYINFSVDKKRGAFMISGDFGDSIAVWYNHIVPEEMSGWIYNDVYYYISKMQCSSNIFVYDEDDILADIMEHLDEDGIESLLESNSIYENIDELKEALAENIENSLYNRNTFIPSPDLIDMFCENDPDYWEWLPECGKRVDGRVYIWVIGFRMALKQLKMI